MPDLWASGYAGAVVITMPLQHEMEISRRDERQAGFEPVAVDGFSNFEGALSAQAISKRFREHGRNVLDDRNTRQAGGEMGQDFAQSFGTSGGRSE
jgi:hypothetical protein